MSKMQRIINELNLQVVPVPEEERRKRTKRVSKALKSGIFEIDEEILEGVHCHCCGRYVLQGYHLWSLENNFCVCAEDMESIKTSLNKEEI